VPLVSDVFASVSRYERSKVKCGAVSNHKFHANHAIVMLDNFLGERKPNPAREIMSFGL
jgi:hypothetical protein